MIIHLGSTQFIALKANVKPHETVHARKSAVADLTIYGKRFQITDFNVSKTINFCLKYFLLFFL